VIYLDSSNAELRHTQASLCWSVQRSVSVCCNRKKCRQERKLRREGSIADRTKFITFEFYPWL